MGRYRIGDEVVCVFDLSDDGEPWIHEFKVQVIGYVTGDDFDNDRLLCYVPPYLSIKSSFQLGRYQQKSFDFHPKFIGEQGVFVDEDQVIKHHPTIPGEVCTNCKLLVQYATGESYTCWECRENPYR